MAVTEQELNGTAPASESGPGGIRGMVQGLAQRLTGEPGGDSAPTPEPPSPPQEPPDSATPSPESSPESAPEPPAAPPVYKQFESEEAYRRELQSYHDREIARERREASQQAERDRQQEMRTLAREVKQFEDSTDPDELRYHDEYQAKSRRLHALVNGIDADQTAQEQAQSIAEIRRGAADEVTQLWDQHTFAGLADGLSEEGQAAWQKAMNAFAAEQREQWARPDGTPADAFTVRQRSLQALRDVWVAEGKREGARAENQRLRTDEQFQKELMAGLTADEPVQVTGSPRSPKAIYHTPREVHEAHYRREITSAQARDQLARLGETWP